MKLIPARCPSCGSNIEVDKEKSTTKCEYCDTKIIIEDAIEKYKIELSGNVKIDNLPTALNYLKLGTRNLDKGEYKKAHEQLEKAIELDPDNPSIIIKESLSKTLMSELNKSSFDQIICSIQEIKKIYNEDIDEHILYCIDILERKRKEISNLINLKPNKVTFEKLINNYINYLRFYEVLFRNYITQDDNKIKLIRKIFACIQSFNNGGQYSVITNRNIHYITYIPNNDTKLYIANKTEQYENELAELDDDFREQRLKQKQNYEKALQQTKETKKQRTNNMKKQLPLIIDFIISICCLLFISIFVLVSLMDANAVSVIIYGIAMFVTLPFIALKYLPPIKKLIPQFQIIIAICRYILAFILFFIGTLFLAEVIPPYVDSTFVSNSSKIKITISEDHIKIIDDTEHAEKELFSYTEEECEDGYVINVIDNSTNNENQSNNNESSEKIIAQYKYIVESESLCLLENKTCKEYYTKKESQK